MKLFGFFKNKEIETFRISDSDRIWIEENFRCLIHFFGCPKPESKQIQFSENFFPMTFGGETLSIENVIKDFCALLQIQEDKINFNFVSDIRDSYGVPYQMDGKPFESVLEIVEGRYVIHIANSLQKHPKRLIYCLVFEFIRIKLDGKNLQYDAGNDVDLFIYLAGIFFGFGVFLSQNLRDIGRDNDGIWETQWNYIAEMPIDLMVFALATYSILIEQDSPDWKVDLPSDIKSLFENAIKFSKDNPSKICDKNELEANELFGIACDQYLKNQYEDALANLQKILLLTNDDALKADVYNNLGYYNIRLRNYELAVAYFKNAIHIRPDYGYAYDNLGYVLIQLGRLEEGRLFLERALQTENNEIAYTNRNMALYYQAKGDMNKAFECFKNSFDTLTDSVDLLEYHYADFLIKNGETAKGLEFLKKAVEKGEHEAIERMNEMKEREL